MTLVRVGAPGRGRPAVLVDGACVDVSAFVGDHDEAFVGNGGLAALGEWLTAHHQSAASAGHGRK